jgi:hypothetical protein
MRRLWLLLVVGPLRHLLTIHHRYHLIPLVPLRRGLFFAVLRRSATARFLLRGNFRSVRDAICFS